MMQNDASFAKQPDPGHHLLYNGLADVVEADRHLTASGRTAVLDDLMDVIRAHEVQNFAGIRLLHRHCDIGVGEIMVEQDFEEDGTPALATRPEAFTDLRRRVVPNSYRISGGQLQPLEYSDDPVVHEASDQLLARQGFLADFAATLHRHSMTDTLGLMIAPRSFYQKPVPAGRPVLVESSYDDIRWNVVRYHASDEFDPDKLLQTAWVVPDSLLAASCPSLCSMKCKLGHNMEHEHLHPPKHWKDP